MNTVDRRRHLRYEVEAPVLVQDNDEEFWAVARDVSQGGVFLCTERALPLWSDVRAKLVPRSGHYISARARVVRVTADGVGCAFSQLSKKSARALAAWLGPSGGLQSVVGVIER